MMKIDDLEPLLQNSNNNNNAIEFLKSEGYSALYPPQEDTIKAGLLEGKSILVSAPTASGKTLIAMIAMINNLSQDDDGNKKKTKKKIIYLSPLRALAAEKFTEFKKLEKVFANNTNNTNKKEVTTKKITVKISTGDFESLEKEGLEKADILVMTNEKMDSVMRKGPDWIEDISLVIADEVHLIGDQDRGPTLEIVLTKLKMLDSRPQIVGLSATITNSDEIAEWLGCDLVTSKWRPVPLHEGVYEGGKVVMNNGDLFEVSSSIRGPPVDLGLQSVLQGGQSLVFAETRSRSASLATKASDVISKELNQKEKKSLEKISKDILDKNEHTELVKRLAELVKKGVAFHHAGLNQNCRETIETQFRKGTIKLLSSTPTLAAGVNLPARRVVISNVNRYNPKVGANMPISVLEYKQLCGRAGRPQFDKYGEAIVVGRSNNGEEILDYYINGEPEPIESKITDDKALRTHILSLIVTTPGIKKEDLLEFFLQTLGGLQSRKPTLKFGMDIATRFLSSEKLILRKTNRFAATDFGKTTSKLYLDPLTATYFRNAITSSSEGRDQTFGILHLISECEEFFPRFSLRNKDYERMSTLIENYASELIEPISEYDCNRSLLALHDWINESSEVALSDNLGIESGDMHRMVETADWLLYCMRELSKQFERADLLEELDILRTRIRYGIKAELTDLVKVKGIGRVRARRLYKEGIKTRQDLRKVPVKKLAEIDKIGLTLADNIKAQLRRVG